MVQRLIQILFAFDYVDQTGDFEDCIYMRENTYMNYDDFDVIKRIIENYFDETDRSKRLKQIKEVRYLGLRLV